MTLVDGGFSITERGKELRLVWSIERRPRLLLPAGGSRTPILRRDHRLLHRTSS